MLTLGIINYEPDQTTYTLQIQTGDKLFDTFLSVSLESGEQW